MEQETSSALNLALGLIIVSMIIAIVVSLIFQGQRVINDSVTGTADMLNSMDSKELEALITHGEDIPVASIYLLLERDIEKVQSISGVGIYSSINTIDDLTNYLSDLVYVSGNRTAQGYNIVIRQ